MKKFALIGSNGYIAPRHLQAIKDVGGQLITTLDHGMGEPSALFPNAAQFDQEKDFFSYLGEHQVDFVCVCSPSFLHAKHINWSMKMGANVICEKPVVITEQELDQLRRSESKYGKTVYSIRQLRYHSVFREIMDIEGDEFDIQLTIQTPRDDAYFNSWKGDIQKSGGIAMNLGIHYFDILIERFGEVQEIQFIHLSNKRVIGDIRQSNAVTNFDFHLLDEHQDPVKEFIINNKVFSLSGEQALHSKAYSEILDEKGITLEEFSRCLNLFF